MPANLHTPMHALCIATIYFNMQGLLEMASGLGYFSGPVVGELLYQVGQLHAGSKFETIDSIRNSSCILQI